MNAGSRAGDRKRVLVLVASVVEQEVAGKETERKRCTCAVQEEVFIE